jgi:hypothetical protein
MFTDLGVALGANWRCNKLACQFRSTQYSYRSLTAVDHRVSVADQAVYQE